MIVVLIFASCNPKVTSVAVTHDTIRIHDTIYLNKKINVGHADGDVINGSKTIIDNHGKMNVKF